MNYDRVVEKLCIAVAWLMPRRLVYWCWIRVESHASTGQYANRHPESLTAGEVGKAWQC